MSRFTSIFIVLLVAAVIGFSVYNFYLTHEYKEHTIHTGLRGEARTNPLYASRLFLKRMGIPTETKNSVQGLNGFPDTNTVLLITTKRTTLSPQRTNDLIDWVKSGGHLIASATRDWKYNGADEDGAEEIDDDKKISPDPLQRFMGVYTGSRIRFKDDEDEEEESIIDEFLNKEKDPKKIRKIELQGVDKKLALDNPWYRPIHVREKHKAKTEQIILLHNNYMVRQKVGNGLITLVSDLDFIENSNIEDADHAEILWHLVHGLHKPISQPKNIWLIHNDEMPSLWALLKKHAWTFLLSLLILFIAWLMMSTRRFGPMIPKQEENRRSLMEHITSSGNFYWKYNEKEKLVESSRKALTDRLMRVHPGWAQRSKEEQIKLLAEQVSMTPEAIQKLLYSPNIEHADEFTQLIRQLEKIRKEI